MDNSPTRPFAEYKPLSAVRAVTFAAVLLIFALGIYIQTQVLLNHDVGWVTHSAGWLLDGGVFGREIFAANPPLIWWLSVPAASISRVTTMTDADAIRLLVWISCLSSLWLSARLLRDMRRTVHPLEAAGLLTALAFALCLLPGAIFAQREHIAFTLAVPYAILQAARATEQRTWPFGLTLAVGILAGIAFSLKPYFLLVPALLQVCLFATHRSPRGAITVETFALVATILAYLACVAMFASDYLTTVLPIVKSIYWGFENNSSFFLYGIVASALWMLLAALALALATRSAGPLHTTLAATAIGFLGSFWLQAKGYEYHAYPVAATALVLLTYSAIVAVREIRRRWSGRASVLQTPAAILVAALWSHQVWPSAAGVGLWYSRANISNGDLARPRLQLIDEVAALVETPEDCVYAFSTHPFPGFPTMNYVEARWGARSNSQFAIPAIIRSRHDPGNNARNMADAEHFTRESVLEDFRRCPPRVVIVLNHKRRHALGFLPYDELVFFTEDPRFAEIWQQYALEKTVANARLYVRAARTPVGTNQNDPLSVEGPQNGNDSY